MTWNNSEEAHRHYEKHQEEIKLRVKKRANLIKWEVFTHYSNGTPKCSCCGETHIEFLTIDHINNDGAEQRRNIHGRKTGKQIYHWLKKNNFPKEFRVLCYNCNCSRGHQGYCPHENEVIREVGKVI